LRSIIVPEVEFTDESLTGVADYLTRISKDLDPSGIGINFVLDIGEEDAALRDISVNLILRSVPIGEVVRFVTEATGTKFRIEQFAVVITSLNSASTELVTKSFLVPPDFLNSPPPGDEGGGFDDPFGAGGDTNTSNLITRRLDAKTYLVQAGVVFPDGSFASHTVSNNTLIVRNTQANIDLVESLVNTLNRGVQQMVRIDVKQVEFLVAEGDELTFDILLDYFNIPGSSSVFGSGGTGGQDPADFAFTRPAGDSPVGRFSLTSGIRSGDYAVQTNAINSVTGAEPVSAPGANKASSMFGISSVFGDPQAQMAIRAINQNKTVTFTNQPTTVTQPGQRSVIEVLRQFPYPTEYDPPEIPQTFSQERGQDVVLIDPVNNILFVFPGQEPPNTFPVTPAHPNAFDVRNVGTRMEVEPTIDPDGYTVTLNLSVEFSQFEGFINYGTPIATSDGVVLTDNRILQPLFKVSRLAQPVHVQDGSNFVIGGIMGEDVEWTNDKVPLFGDIPLVGRLFRGKVQQRQRKAVLFFVKVRILDPSGQPVNRVLQSASAGL
ncbi:MAG: type II secretion system protein GspD, partial [Verrucomicrobiales bacterium]